MEIRYSPIERNTVEIKIGDVDESLDFVSIKPFDEQVEFGDMDVIVGRYQT